MERMYVMVIKVKTLCKDAERVLRPYILTLRKDGMFDWLRDDEPVIVQCPNPYGSVVFKVHKNIIRVKEVRGVCSRKYKVGDEFECADIKI